MKRNMFKPIAAIIGFAIMIAGCKKDDFTYVPPTPNTALQNDAMKRSLGPNLAGENIEFVYAVALGAGKGKITSAQVEASIAGAEGTYIDAKTYYTNPNGGVDVGTPVSAGSVHKGTVTSIDLNKDTNTVAFRYYYKVPAEARGQNVSFTFQAKSTTGETVTYKLGPYAISKMDMVKNLAVTDAKTAYISIADMKVYDSAGAAANPGKIDLVYIYRPSVNSPFNHSLMAPAADTAYLAGAKLPPGLTNNSKLMKVFNLQDRHLSNLQYGIYVDDADFLAIDLSKQPNFAINLIQDAGVWVETADKKYKAYVYINSINNNTKSAVISMKRYTF